jgi:hypothetical protein
MKVDIQKHWGDSELFYIGELCSKIINSMHIDGEVYLYTKEGKNGYNNGMFDLLDELCAYNNWDKKLITLDTSNSSASHPEYNIVYTEFNHTAAYIKLTDPVLPWNRKKYYGMFIGRANSSRIRAVHNNFNFKFKEHGLTSFNTDLFNFMNKTELVDYYCHSGQTYQEMISIKPYSDIGPIILESITPIIDNVNWSRVYEKIAIDIVCETSVLPDCTDMSEKIIRPMYFKRPFLLIGSPSQLKFLKNRGFKTFDNIIPSDYDQCSGMTRVDAVFNILEQLISSEKIHDLLELCSADIEHNHKLIVEYCTRHKSIYKNMYRKINDKK